MSEFSILGITDQLGESVTISGVSRTYNTRGDATETYTSLILSSVVVEILNSEDDLVKEGIMQRNDIMVFIDETDDNALVAADNYITVSTTISGIYIIREVIDNKGHLQVLAKKYNI